MENQPQDYALLSFSGVKLMFPQSQVLSVEVTQGLQHAEDIPGSIGCIDVAEQTWPVFVLSPEFELVETLPDNHRYCLGIRSDTMIFALACETVSSHKVDDPIAMHALADCMRLAESPLQALLIYHDALAMVSSADGFSHYLQNKVIQP